MSKDNKQVLRRFENYLDHGDIKALEPKETKKTPPKLSCSFNSNLKTAVNHIISNHKWDIKLNDCVLQFRPCNRSKDYNFSTSVGITISNMLKKQNIQFAAVDISKEIIKYMIEEEKCDFKNEVCDNGYINIYDIKPVEIKEEDKSNGENENKKRKIDNNPDHKPHVYSQKVYPSEYHNKSFYLYEKYQKIIHHDDDSDKKGYTRFLITSLLEYEPPEKVGFQPGRGSFHLEHWIDDKLIAVSVIDIVTESVSSVYCFYDPDYNFLEIGKVTILKEIEFAKKIKEMKYYTLGYYNPNVVKLKYKAEYQPCELLCDLQQQFYPFNIAYEKLKNNGFKYTPFVENADNYRLIKERMIETQLKKYIVNEEGRNKLRDTFKYLGIKFGQDNSIWF